MSAHQVRAVRSLAEPLIAALDCDLEEVVVRQAGRRRVVRIIVDHDGGLPLDLVARISREVSHALDDSDVMGQAPYVLEVSSPGVDRPLSRPRHWVRAVGRLVDVTLQTGGQVQGRVRSAGPDSAVLDVAGRSTTVGYADVARAVVQVEFTRIDDVDLDEDTGQPSGDGTGQPAGEGTGEPAGEPTDHGTAERGTGDPIDQDG